MGALLHDVVGRLHQLEQRKLSHEDVLSLSLELFLQDFGDQRHSLAGLFGDD